MAEAKVLALFQQHNKPFNIQSLVDFLATQGVKKAAIQKALDTLVEQGKVSAKDFGKTKIYLPNQEGLQVLSKEELDEKKARARNLQEELRKETGRVRELEAELRSWQSFLSQAEVEARIEELTAKIEVHRGKLEGLRGGALLVTAEERACVEKAFVAAMEHWRKRRGIFRSIWDTISEGIDGKEADLFEEIGVDSDEASCISYKDLEQLLPSKSVAAAGGGSRKRPIGAT